ncbi:MAG: hypothetical protein IJ190_10100 [Prevotella sp.]|nr:hypothetical protein [Prevotella sp.]
MYKKLFIGIAIVILSFGCGKHFTSSDLSKIDSLVSAEKYDSAYHEVLMINPQAILDPEDKAHYNLLLTQTSCLIGKPCLSDSLIDFSISFYEKIDDNEKLCDALYYKAELCIFQKDYDQAIALCKKAEKLANQIGNSHLLFKVVDSIAYINGICGNYDLELQYAKQSLEYALKAEKMSWVASSYCRICEAYQILENTDSAIFYADNALECIENADTADLPYYLNTIGFAYLEKDSQKAKEYFEKSLSYKPLTRTLENLAWVYHMEGNEDKAYEYWKQALLAEDNVPKANILHNLLQYDLEHHNIEGACERLGDIVSIKDSLNNVLKDRSIQKIQQDFDEKVVQERHERIVFKWTTIALALVVIILLLLSYIQYRRHKARILLAEHQMLISNYQSEINSLKNNQEGTEQQITDLNQKIIDLLEQDSPRLYNGKMLYDQIMENGTTVTWSQEDYRCFIDFYKATHIANYTRITKKYHPKTAHNIFFLILCDIGKKDTEIRQIMGITQEAIRSIRYRISKNAKK